jgi:hypothetical protein
MREVVEEVPLHPHQRLPQVQQRPLLLTRGVPVEVVEGQL